MNVTNQSIAATQLKINKYIQINRPMDKYLIYEYIWQAIKSLSLSLSLSKHTTMKWYWKSMIFFNDNRRELSFHLSWGIVWIFLVSLALSLFLSSFSSLLYIVYTRSVMHLVTVFRTNGDTTNDRTNKQANKKKLEMRRCSRKRRQQQKKKKREKRLKKKIYEKRQQNREFTARTLVDRQADSHI